MREMHKEVRVTGRAVSWAQDLSFAGLVTVVTVPRFTCSHREGKGMSHVLGLSIRQVQRLKTMYIAQIQDPFWKISWDSRNQSRLQHMLAMFKPILSLKKNKIPKEMDRASKLWKGTQVPDKWLSCECILYWLTSDSKLTHIWPGEKVVLLKYIHIHNRGFQSL